MQFSVGAPQLFSGVVDPQRGNGVSARYRETVGLHLELERQEYIRPILEAFARDYQDNLGLGGYYLHDERNAMRFGRELAWTNEVLSAADINRPTWGAANHDSFYGYNIRMSDMIVASVGNGGFRREFIENFPNRPVVSIVATYTSNSARNMRSFAWRAICEGVTGISIWHWEMTIGNTYTVTPEFRAQAQQNMKELFDELAEYEPIILSTEPAPHFTVVGGQPSWLSITTRRHNGKSYLFATNNTNQTRSTTVSIGGITKTLDFGPFGMILTDDIPQNAFLSPLAKFHSLGFASGTHSLLVTYDKDGNKTLHIPNGINTVQYGARISKNAKLYINGEPVDTTGTLTLDGPGTLTVKVVSQDGQHYTEKTFAYVAPVTTAPNDNGNGK